MTVATGSKGVVEHGTRRTLIIVAVMAATLMQTLDTTITNVALPNIQGNIGASLDEATWVITAYTIAAIIVIPLTPWLQSRFGRKNYYVASIIGFTVASVLCGDSHSLGSLASWRIVQGLFGGGLLATAQVILRDTFPPEKLSTSQGIFTIGAVMGPALGPPIGGILVDNYSWNWCFDINVVPGTFSAIVLFLLLRNPESPKKSPVDSIGVVLLALALGSMQYVLTEGEQHDWFSDPVILCMTIVCIVSATAFVVYELMFTANPVVDLRVLAKRTVWAGSLLALAQGAVLLGSTYILPQYVQGSLGFTPTLSGMLFLLRAIPVALCTPLIVALIGEIDARAILAAGFIITGVATVVLAWYTTSLSFFWTFALPLALSGVGGAALFIPLSVAVLSGTPPKDGPKAGAFLNLAVQLGGSIAVAALNVLIDRREQFHSAILAAEDTLKNPAVKSFLYSHSLAQLAGLVYGQATVLSYADGTLAMGVASLVCIPLVALIGKRQTNAPVA
ncbi:MAG: DHA2 family efflux MFS transporter permease subunit [Candidatus Eremiobacteraeota bacterium]|nr:DHA2 family efflux MFS transporter permease subunit [Candidatus Eremiobacteraeota bacterium]